MARTIDDQTNQKYDPNIAQITTKQQLVDYLKNAASSVDNIASGLGNAVSGVYNKVAASTPESVPDNKNKPPTEGAGSVSATPTNAGTIVNQQSYTPVSPTDYSAYYESLRRSKIQGLQNAAQQQKNALAERKSGIDPRYNASKTQADVQGQIAGSRLAQIMANRGYSTGNQAQNMLIQNAQTQGEVSNLEAQRQAEQDQVARNSQNIDTTLASDIAAANNDIDSQRLKSLIDEQNRVDALNYSRSRDTVADSEWNQQFGETKRLNDSNIAGTQANTEAQILQNKENADPNSVTNQMKQLGLDTAKINYSILDQTSKAQVDSVLAELKSKNISNEQAQYELNELTDPNSTTNQIKNLELAQKNQDLLSSSAQYAEWLKLAPQRIKVAQEQALQATSASQLARLQVQAEQEDVLAKKIDVANMNQQQKDQHAKVLMDIQDTKSAIANRAAQLGIQAGQLKLERDKFDYSKNSTKTVSANLKPYQTYIDKYLSRNVTDDYGTTTGKTIDQKSAANYIVGLNLKDADTDALLQANGLPTDINALKKIIGN